MSPSRRVRGGSGIRLTGTGWAQAMEQRYSALSEEFDKGTEAKEKLRKELEAAKQVLAPATPRHGVPVSSLGEGRGRAAEYGLGRVVGAGRRTCGDPPPSDAGGGEGHRSRAADSEGGRSHSSPACGQTCRGWQVGCLVGCLASKYHCIHRTAELLAVRCGRASGHRRQNCIATCSGC